MVGKVFITGVSSGIGLGLAREYLRQKVAVYGVSRREPEELLGEGSFRFQSVDLKDSQAVPDALKSLLAGAGRLDVVVLNAGVLGRVADMGEISAEEFRAVLEVNLVANKVVLDAIFRMGIPVQQVVGISSGAGTTANRGWNAYAVSKAGLNMMMALYAAERPETHFCALAPGIVDTAMQERISEMPREERFASLDLLRSAKGTPMMPKPEVAAGRLIDGIAKAMKYASGEFLDLRSLGKRQS